MTEKLEVESCGCAVKTVNGKVVGEKVCKQHREEPKVHLPKDFGKMKTSTDHYKAWVKTLPKGTQVKTYMAEDMFTAVVVHNVMNFSYEYDYGKKPKTAPIFVKGKK